MRIKGPHKGFFANLVELEWILMFCKNCIPSCDEGHFSQNEASLKGPGFDMYLKRLNNGDFNVDVAFSHLMYKNIANIWINIIIEVFNHTNNFHEFLCYNFDGKFEQATEEDIIYNFEFCGVKYQLFLNFNTQSCTIYGHPGLSEMFNKYV